MSIRDHVRNTLSTALHSSVESKDGAAGADLGAELELSILRHATESCRGSIVLPTWDHEEVRAAYLRKYKMIIHNLVHPDCTLRQDLRTGSVSPDDACQKTHEDLRPDIWVRLAKQKEAETEAKTTDAPRQSDLPCNNCARKGLPCYNTEYREFQTRAGDEASTIYAFCRTCQKRWKFSG
jgi:DNA-directed RNA polymerase subunit M/transcription elongation factor TFIIS